MKKALPVSLLLAAVAVIALIWVKGAAATKERSEIALLQQQLRETQSESNAEQERALALERNLNAGRIGLAEKQEKAALPKALGANNPPGSNQTSLAQANLLKDPAMRQMMQKQQMQALERNVKQLVNSDLQKKLNLTAEEAAGLRELLTKKQRPAIDLLIALMSGELDQDQAAALSVRAKQERI